MSRPIRILLAATAVVLVVLTLLRANVFWRNEAYLDDASGNWTALAKDLTAGVFYRPLHGAAGYGGSRYFPFHFVLHAGVMKLLGDPIRSGYAVSALSMTLLIAGVYLLLRRLDAPRLLAVACGTSVLAARPAQEALLAIKGDALAAALNVWGVALVAGTTPGWLAIAGAALLFTLAFATKLTMVSGVAAAGAWLWFSGRRRESWKLCLVTGCGLVVVLGLIGLASQGVAFEVLRASASGGATVADILLAPLTLARQARRVPETLVFIQLGISAFLILLFSRRPRMNLPSAFFLAVLAVTTVIFGSPGTDTNHFVDLHVASLVLVGSWIVVSGLASDFAAVALVVAALAASLSLGSGLANAQSEARRGRFSETLALIPDKARPILAQNPLLPVVAGQRPYLLDPFLIRAISVRDPSFAEPLWNDIRNQKFSAVVFEADPGSGRARELYRSALLGERFLDEVERHYAVAGSVGTRTIYLPRAH